MRFRTCTAQLTSFSVVASCGLLPRTTRPGPRLWTAFWSVASTTTSVGSEVVRSEIEGCGLESWKRPVCEIGQEPSAAKRRCNTRYTVVFGRATIRANYRLVYACAYGARARLKSSHLNLRGVWCRL